MSWSRALITFFADAFRPPWRTTPWIVLLYVVLCAIYNGDSQFNRWALPDTDDYMRLRQMLTWLNGQSWFDLRIPNLYPDHIIAMHWGRLPDLLLAGVYLLIKHIAWFYRWETTQQSLAMLTAFFVPCIMLTGLLFLLRALARPILGRKHAGVVCFLVPICSQLIFQFLPMRVDHHAYIILSAGVAFYGLQAFALHVRPRRMMALAGLAFALGMWNGAEIMPMLVMFCFALGIDVILERRNYSVAALFGGSLLVANFIILFIAKSPAERWSIEYDAFSFFYVILAALVAAYFLVLWGASLITRHRAILFAFAAFAGLGGVALLLHYFPDFILGPYAKANPALNTLFFPNIREAVPFYKSWADLGDMFSSTPRNAVAGIIYHLGTRAFVILTGLAVALYIVFRKNSSARQKKLWAFYAFFILGFSALTMAWQVRVITYAQLFGVIPLAWLILRYLAQLPKHYQGRTLFTYEVLTVFALTALPVIFIPALINKYRFMPDILFYLGRSVDTPCNNRIPVISYLQDLSDREKKIATVMAPMDYTPELLFYTKHNFIAAPYHRNDRGIIDMVNFFRSRPNDESARKIAKRLKLDYVLVCKTSYFQTTLNRSPEVQNVIATVNGNKMDYKPVTKDLDKASLGMRLAYDKVPGWLEKRDIPLETDFALFEVKKNRLGR